MPNALLNSNHLSKIIKIQARLAEANFDLDKFMDLVVIEVQKLTSAIGVVVELVEGTKMVYKAATGTVKSHIGLSLNRKGSISGLCVKQKKILISDDTEKDKRVNVNACRLVRARSLVVAPLFHDGEAIGVLKILSDKPHAFHEDDINTLQLMAGLIGSALMHQIFYKKTEKLLQERTKTLKNLKIAKEKLKHMAHHDFLTTLPNRSLFIDRLMTTIKFAKRKKLLFALLYLDIDHFKTINDTLGHAIGDELLKAFASRVKQTIRDSDTLARLGGDEFVILLVDLSQKNDAIKIANKIIAKMKDPFRLQNQNLNISTSIGIAYYVNSDISADELIQQADCALYMAKQKGRNNYKIFKSK